ncbi:MAG: hypothetical protein DRJ03_06805 [Chloroflexi bacterium]|nr:MAG: hypothetical protein DRJ03_06805 [Chloroflexota bacterium]
MKALRVLSILVALTLVFGLVASCAPKPTAAPTESPAEPTEAPAEPTEASAEPEPTDVPEPEPEPELMSYSAESCDYGGEFLTIESLDDLTVKFTLCYPDPAFPSKIAFSAFPSTILRIWRRQAAAATSSITPSAPAHTWSRTGTVGQS